MILPIICLVGLILFYFGWLAGAALEDYAAQVAMFVCLAGGFVFCGAFFLMVAGAVIA